MPTFGRHHHYLPVTKPRYRHISGSIQLPKYNAPASSPPSASDIEELYQKISNRLTEVECNLIATSKHEGVDTRQHVSEELAKAKTELKALIEKGQLTIIDCIKFNATKNIQILCIYAAISSIFCLAISIILGVQLVNPFLSILVLISSVGFYLMTKVEQGKSEKK